MPRSIRNARLPLKAEGEFRRDRRRWFSHQVTVVFRPRLNKEGTEVLGALVVKVYGQQAKDADEHDEYVTPHIDPEEFKELRKRAKNTFQAMLEGPPPKRDNRQDDDDDDDDKEEEPDLHHIEEKCERCREIGRNCTIRRKKNRRRRM